ncbi:MAG: ABC transporter ATP-binding protein [Candidatus Thiodiazotropha sp. (ex Dulcina madagascariensis)]|nr:ABC transporter ATP-binding protein [Candidatus Thiodiazotropha sp. (ex Dulcina madagascariensis)]MCU7927832.1 ABC transporter ATP-binding protein [Candidatus Thiodiazotropha sp. (ex Dulcina madagascariensis)]
MNSNPSSTRGVVIENLSLAFGETEVLKGVNLSISEGEFFAFLGPSGSGKSTLLRAIAGFGPKPRGRILIQNIDIADQPPWKRDVGMVFQSYALWPHMTVRKNVAFGLEERKTPKGEIDGRVDAALDMVGLRHLADRRPSQLSGGQQQRIALARTIVVEPKVLLLDEPLSNLDANLRIQMRREIRELQQKLKLTTIFVTHDQEEANTTSDRMAVLENGIIQQVGTPMELYDNPANLIVAKFLGTANIIQGEILHQAGTAVFKSINGTEITTPSKRMDAKYMVFRPQNVSILSKGENLTGCDLILSGRVSHKEFLGSIVRYSVEVGGNQVLVDDPHRMGQQVFGIDDEVVLTLQQEQMTLLNGH